MFFSILRSTSEVLGMKEWPVQVRSTQVGNPRGRVGFLVQIILEGYLGLPENLKRALFRVLLHFDQIQIFQTLPPSPPVKVRIFDNEIRKNSRQNMKK